MTTCLFPTIQKPPRASARARVGALCAAPTSGRVKATYEVGKCHVEPLRANFSFCATTSTFRIRQCTNTITRERAHARPCARVGALCAAPPDESVKTMSHGKSHREPLGAHFSYQANMATFLFQTLQKHQRASASARASAHCAQHQYGRAKTAW